MFSTCEIGAGYDCRQRHLCSFQSCPCRSSLVVKSHLPNVLADNLQQERGLDAGEANAIALALELQADDLLIDERLGRQEAVRLGLSIIGILGILLVAKQRSLIPQVQPVMDALINKAGFRVSTQLYQRVLALAKEP